MIEETGSSSSDQEQPPTSENDIEDGEIKITDTPDEKKPSKEPKYKKQNLTLSYSFTSAMPKGQEPIIDLPSGFTGDVNDTFGNQMASQMLDNEDARQWGDAVRNSLTFSSYNDAFIKTLQKPTAGFEQYIETNGQQVSARTPVFKKKQNENLKGSRAVMRVLEKRGLGSLFQTPLWHTGIWLNFKPPTDTAIVELNRQLVSDKIQFGRETYGLIFSNTSVYSIARLVEFALDHVFDTTLKDDNITPQVLKKIISAQDIPTVLWGLACAMYSDGFPYRRACVSDPSKCNHVTEELLNLSKLSWTDKNSLTDWQKTHMSNRMRGSRSADTIERYKEEMASLNKKRCFIGEDGDESFTMLLKTPTIEEYIESGYTWVDDIVAFVEDTAGSDLSPDDKNVLIARHGQATSMRQYAHWVDSISIDSNIIDDSESIDQCIDALTPDMVANKRYMESISDYINSSTVSVIGIPEYACVNCDEIREGDKTLPHHTNIIPLDVVQLFFALTMNKMEAIATR